MVGSSRERVELEAKIAFQEKAITDLNEALVDQAKTLMELAARVAALESVVRRLNHAVDAAAERPPNEKPPHY